MSNPYYSPEGYGLEVFGNVEAGSGYEYDTFVIWTTSDGRFVWAEDSGCSCPIPFEDIDPFDQVPGKARDALNALLFWAHGADYSPSRRDEDTRHLQRRLEDAQAQGL